MVMLTLFSISCEKYPSEVHRLFHEVQFGSCKWICEVQCACTVQCE